jgi:signal transduction histidine kinase
VIDSRWSTVLAITPYVVLGTLVAFTLGIEWGAWSRLAPDLALCAGLAVWILVFRSLQLRWAERPAAISVFLTGAILFNLVLVLREGYFGFLAIATFTFAFSLAAWPWELLAVGATAVVAGIAQSSSFSRDTVIGVVGTVVVIVLNITVMCGMSWGLQLATRLTERTGAEAERARLAREIHDTLAQGLAGIVTQLQAAEQASDEAARRRHTDAAIGLAREGLAEARRSVTALRPAALDVMRLPEAIAAAASRWTDRTGIPVEVRVEGVDRPLRTDAEVVLLRTAQEALANIERHARAERVTLTLRREPAAARIEIRDDGHGFDPSATRSPSADGGFGLIAMRERIEALAGRLEVESAHGRGTAVRAEVPA